jgi:hypothetical protein
MTLWEYPAACWISVEALTTKYRSRLTVGVELQSYYTIFLVFRQHTKRSRESVKLIVCFSREQSSWEILHISNQVLLQQIAQPFNPLFYLLRRCVREV